MTDLLLEMKNPILLKYLENENFKQNLSKNQKDLDEIMEKFLINHLDLEMKLRKKEFF